MYKTVAPMKKYIVLYTIGWQMKERMFDDLKQALAFSKLVNGSITEINNNK